MSKILVQNELQSLTELIREYMDIFIWNYENMLGVDPNIVQHHFNIS